MGLRGLVGLARTYKLIGNIKRNGNYIEATGDVIQVYTGWQLDFYKQCIGYNDPPFKEHYIQASTLHGTIYLLQKTVTVKEERSIRISNSFNRSHSYDLDLKRDDILEVYPFNKIQKKFKEMIAEKRNYFLQQQEQQELVRQEQLQIRKSATQEEYRNFVRGASKSLSGDVFFTSPAHQLTESIGFLKSFFERCFDTELRNNRRNEVKVYNPSIGDYEYMSYHHLAFMKGKELAAIKEIIVKTLCSNWKDSLNYTYADEFNANRPSIYDFKEEIYGMNNNKVNPNVRVIQFDNSLSELLQTFIHKLFAEK